MKLYCVSGLGADERVFAHLKLQNVEVVHLPWLEPEEDESADHYCRRLAGPIDTSEKFGLLGLSFGGMCVQQMTGFLDPEFLVLISTVKSREEMPPYMRVMGIDKFQKVVPEKFYQWAGVHSKPVLGVPEDEQEQQRFDDMIMHSSPELLRWSVAAVVSWQGAAYKQPFIHVHGTEDRVFPARYIHDCTFIEGGTHYMVVNQAGEVSEVINGFLSDLGGGRRY